MKLVETLANPAPYQKVMLALKTAEKAGIVSATVTFNSYIASVGGGRDTESVVEITIEGPSNSE